MAPTATSMPAQLTTDMETHASRLIFDDRWVFKSKKPLDLGFVDNRTVEARRLACEEEVRLNRRLAPDVYRGVVDHRLPDGSVEPTVVMRRLPAEQRLTTCIAEGLDVRDALDDIARQLVCLHQQSGPGPEHDDLDSAAARLGRWNDAADRLRPLIAGTSLEIVAARADELAERYLRGREPLFRARIAAGRVRDGHGDLRAEDIFLMPDGPVILDCLEFDENLRWGDVLDDIAFLAMDLRALGRPELAHHLLDRYRRLSGDRWPPSLVEMAIAQRAHIRAMIDAVRANQRGADPAAAAAAKLALCVEALEAAQVRMVLVGGAPGTGKTTLAAADRRSTGGRRDLERSGADGGVGRLRSGPPLPGRRPARRLRGDAPARRAAPRPGRARGPRRHLERPRRACGGPPDRRASRRDHGRAVVHRTGVCGGGADPGPVRPRRRPLGGHARSGDPDDRAVRGLARSRRDPHRAAARGLRCGAALRHLGVEHRVPDELGRHDLSGDRTLA